MKKVILATIFLFLPFCSICFAYEYEIIDLGHSYPYPSFYPYDVNDAGHVVGATGQFGYKSETPPFKAALWRKGELIELGNIGETYGRAWSINNKEQIVGDLIFPDESSVNFLYNNKTITELPHIEGSYSYRSFTSIKINERGQIIGTANMYGGNENVVLWENQNPINVSTLIGINGYGADINNMGKIAINSDDRSYIWDGEVLEQLTALEDKGTWVSEMNNLDQAVGSSSSRPIFWDSDGTVIDFDDYFDFENIPSYTSIYASDINDKSQILINYNAGIFKSQEPITAYLYEKGKMFDLNDLLPSDSGWEIFYASAMNNLGQIVGEGSYDGRYTAYLLNPIPEPSSILMFLSGIFGMFWFRKKK